MSKYLSVCATIAWLLVAYSARAEFFDGNRFYAQCEHSEAIDALHLGQCVGYIQGIADGIMESEALGKVGVFCLPPTSTNQQILEVFIDYLKKHPSERHLGAHLLAYGSLLEAFPCAPKRSP